MATSTTAQTDGRILKGQARREGILRAAAAEFGRRGFEATRVIDVAKLAGVSDAGLLHHFPTKLALFNAVVELREEAYIDVASGDIATVRDLFDAMIAAARRAAADPDLLRFRVMLAGSAVIDAHPVAERLRNNFEASLRLFVPVVERGIREGEVAAGTDARQVVLEMLALNDGIRNQWAILPDEVDFAAVFTAALEALYRRIQAPSN